MNMNLSRRRRTNRNLSRRTKTRCWRTEVSPPCSSHPWPRQRSSWSHPWPRSSEPESPKSPQRRRHPCHRPHSRSSDTRSSSASSYPHRTSSHPWRLTSRHRSWRVGWLTWHMRLTSLDICLSLINTRLSLRNMKMSPRDGRLTSETRRENNLMPGLDPDQNISQAGTLTESSGRTLNPVKRRIYSVQSNPGEGLLSSVWKV